MSSAPPRNKKALPGRSMVRDEHVRKNVGAVHITGRLSLVERKLANALLFNAYDNLLVQRTHKISVPILSKMLGWEASKDVGSLKAALVALASTALEFNLTKEGEDSWRVMSMISFGEIHGGVCTYRYDEDLAQRLFDPAVYAMINLRIQRRFDSAAALNLYENCVRYKNVGSTGWWTLAFFREIAGAESHYYDDFRRLNARIIKPCISQINEVSDIILTHELQREARQAVAIRFGIRPKTAEELDEQQLVLPGLSFRERRTEDSDITATPAFTRLRDHAISERLAIAWIEQEGAARVEEVVDYVEQQENLKKVHGSTAGYIRKLIEVGADVGISPRQAARKFAEDNRLAADKESAAADVTRRQVEDRRRKLLQEKLDALTADEYQVIIENYRATEGLPDSKSYTPDLDGKPGFTNPLERIKFNLWLARTLTPALSPGSE